MDIINVRNKSAQPNFIADNELISPLASATTTTKRLVPLPYVQSLDDGQLVGGNVEGIDIGCESAESLLAAVRSDESVDLEAVDVVEGLEGLLDLPLVCLDVAHENQGVVLLNLLHGALGIERVDDDLVGVEAGLVVDRLARVLGSTGEREGLRSVEAGVQPDLGGLLAVGASEDSL